MQLSRALHYPHYPHERFLSALSPWHRSQWVWHRFRKGPKSQHHRPRPRPWPSFKHTTRCLKPENSEKTLFPVVYTSYTVVEFSCGRFTRHKVGQRSIGRDNCHHHQLTSWWSCDREVIWEVWPVFNVGFLWLMEMYFGWVRLWVIT